MLGVRRAGATFLLNSPYGPDAVWDHLPREVQQQILDKQLRLFVIDAYEVAREAGLGGPHQHDHADRASSRSPACCRAKSAIGAIKEAIAKTYGKRGEAVVERNFARRRPRRSTPSHEVDRPRDGDRPRRRPSRPTPARRLRAACHRALHRRARRQLPVSALPGRRHVRRSAPRTARSATSPTRSPSGTRAICIQCDKCALVCPHAAIRMKVYDPAALAGAPAAFRRRTGGRRTCRAC